MLYNQRTLENSRACPGQERITIKYGVRHPKYLLRKSPASIASDFLIAYPDCTYKFSSIIREFPQNAVTPAARDRTRNNCPYHCNARQRINSLHKIDIAKNVSSSCRGMLCMIMCDSDNLSKTDPNQWNSLCIC